MKKTVSAILALVLCTSLLCACQKKEPLVIRDSDTCVVIRVEEGTEEMALTEYMTALKQKGELDFTMENGMVTEMNGQKNAADYSSCWMLYTSDPDFSNPAWGVAEYDGKEYGSAALGANELKVQAGELYIWVYQSF